MKITKPFTGLSMDCHECGTKYELEPSDPVTVCHRPFKNQKWVRFNCPSCNHQNQAEIKDFPMFWQKTLDAMEYTTCT